MNVSATLRSYLVGTGSSVWGITRITGLDDLMVKSADTELHFADGAVAARDYVMSSPIIIDAITRDTVTAAGVGSAIAGLKAAWAPSTTDLTLSVTFAGSHSITGRPRGVTFDRSQAYIGKVRAQLTFMDLHA